MIMGIDKFVGDRVEVAPQSPCKRFALHGRGFGSLMWSVAFSMWFCWLLIIWWRGVRVVQLKMADLNHQGRDSLQISHKITFLILCISYLLQSKKLSPNLVTFIISEFLWVGNLGVTRTDCFWLQVPHEVVVDWLGRQLGECPVGARGFASMMVHSRGFWLEASNSHHMNSSRAS